MVERQVGKWFRIRSNTQAAAPARLETRRVTAWEDPLPGGIGGVRVERVVRGGKVRYERTRRCYDD